ncbi:hypothetical protein TNIN_149051, partial [Trichonephila inaurata madagascariensis]
EFIKA